MTFEEWLAAGQQAGYCTAPVCDTHDDTRRLLTAAEAERWEDGGDPCLFVVRVLAGTRPRSRAT